ncbi:hypothetical protein LDENG_00225720 [Lucifuga dentata]|nr:hypothetical protein LDENG_00225720 [Lucifuga dentata]
MFDPNIFNFHTCKLTDSHFAKHTTRMVFCLCFAKFLFSHIIFILSSFCLDNECVLMSCFTLSFEF